MSLRLLITGALMSAVALTTSCGLPFCDREDYRTPDGSWRFVVADALIGWTDGTLPRSDSDYSQALTVGDVRALPAGDRRRLPLFLADTVTVEVRRGRLANTYHWPDIPDEMLPADRVKIFEDGRVVLSYTVDGRFVEETYRIKFVRIHEREPDVCSED